MRRLFRRAAWVVALLLVLGAAYAGLVLVRSHAPVSLPTPSGSFAVGRVEDTGTDPTRGDRRISVWTWYPALPGTGQRAPYAPGPWSGLQLDLPLGETRLDRVRDAALEEATPAPGRFPVVVLEPGLGFAAPQYAAIAEELASRGFVVVGVTPTGSANLTVIDGRAEGPTEAGNPSDFAGNHSGHDEEVAAGLLTTWVGDARFAAGTVGRLEHSTILADHVASPGVAYVGHSFGGAAALEACHEDTSCTAAVDLDGSIYGPVATSGLRVPTLLVGHGGSCITGSCTPRSDEDRDDVRVAQLFRSRCVADPDVATIGGIGHLAFSDDALLYWALPLRWLLGLGDHAGAPALAEVTARIAGTLARGGADDGSAVAP